MPSVRLEFRERAIGHLAIALLWVSQEERDPV